MTSTVQNVPAARQAPERRKARVNRWDSPWLNAKFLVGLGMVLVIMLMGPVGRLFWDVTLAYPASSPLNLPPPWAPGYDQTGLKVVNRVESVSSAATPTPAVATTSSGNSMTGGNPFAKTTPAASEAGVSMTGGNPLAKATAQNAEQDTAPAERQLVGAAAYIRFGTPTWEHPLGTESSGRDMLGVMLVGAPRSLRIGLIAATLGMLIGVVLGMAAGYLGGWVDAIIRTMADAIIVIPALAVLIVIGSYVKVLQINNMALLLALFLWPGPTRLIRAQVLSMRERGYIQMARISGAGAFSIMFGEMMPNMLPYIAASYTGNVSAAILAATGLEVLGLGPTRIPTLGMTIYYAISAAAILRGMWWWWVIPIIALIIVFSGLFLMTTGLDEIANPRLRGRRMAV